MQNLPVISTPQQEAAPQKRSFFGTLASSAMQVGTTAAVGGGAGLALGGVAAAVVPPSKKAILAQAADIFVRDNADDALVVALKNAKDLKSQALENIVKTGADDVAKGAYDAANNLHKIAKENLKNKVGELYTNAGDATKSMFKEAKKYAKQLKARSIIGASIAIGAFAALALNVIQNFRNSRVQQEGNEVGKFAALVSPKLNTTQG